jgi:hypothetical protein
MHNIYFTNKTITQRLKIPNIWPFRSLTYTKPEFLEGKEQILMINPSYIEQSYYRAYLQVFDVQKCKEHIYKTPEGESCVLMFPFIWATLNAGDLTINSITDRSYNYLTIDELEKNRFWAYRDEGLKLMRKGIEEFTHYFPKQSYKK